MRSVCARIVLAVAVAGFVSAAIGQAGADTISYGFRIGPASTEPTQDFPITDTIQQFAPALGTLESVEITYTSSITATWTLTNSGAHRATGTFITTTDIALTTSGNLVDQTSSPTTGDRSYDVGPHNSKMYDVAGHAPTDMIYTTTAILSQFTGAGLVGLTGSASETDTLTPSTGSLSSYSVSGTADITGLVTYTYAAVPEPSSFVLGAIGTLGVLACGARRRSRSSIA